VGVTMNKFLEKAKQAISVEVQSDMMWFSSQVSTEKSTFISEIPAVKWKKNNGKWNANFLFNKNSRAGLYGNNGGAAEDTRGYYVNLLLVRDNTDGLQYNSIDNAKRIKYNELDLIFIKFRTIESTGFTTNI
jgi:hypothetical protein